MLFPRQFLMLFPKQFLMLFFSGISIPPLLGWKQVIFLTMLYWTLFFRFLICFKFLGNFSSSHIFDFPFSRIQIESGSSKSNRAKKSEYISMNFEISKFEKSEYISMKYISMKYISMNFEISKFRKSEYISMKCISMKYISMNFKISKE